MIFNIFTKICCLDIAHDLKKKVHVFVLKKKRINKESCLDRRLF